MKSAKNAVKLLCRYLGLWHLGFALYRLKAGKPMLVVFTFHRVTDLEKSKHYYMHYEKGLDQAAFEKQLDAIGRYFHVADLPEFVEIVRGRKKPARHTALVTFDDADADFIPYAMPSLRRHKMPSVMFAPTDFIATERRFWHLRVSNAIHKLTPENWVTVQRQSNVLPESIRRLIQGEFPAHEEDKAQIALKLNYLFDKEDMGAVLKVIENWETILGQDFVLAIRCMNWDELRGLSGDNVYIESHSASHGKLGQLAYDGVERELRESKIRLENELHRPVTAISYPAGSYSEVVLDAASRTGYEVGFTTQTGLCPYPADGTEIYKLPRYSLYGDTDIEIEFTLGRLAISGLLGTKL